MYNLTQKLTAEFLGTFALIFFGAGAVCVDFQLRSNARRTRDCWPLRWRTGWRSPSWFRRSGTSPAGISIPRSPSDFGSPSGFLRSTRWLIGERSCSAPLPRHFCLKLVIPEETWRNVALGTPELMRDFPRWGGLALEGVDDFLPGAGGVCYGGRRTRHVPRDRRDSASG